MNEFERELPPLRLAQTFRGDDLQAVAAREMGDANRWPELVWLNRLRHPYLTDDPARVTDGVILTGDYIRVPSAASPYQNEVDVGQLYERDCRMVRRQLVDDGNGDFAVLSGVDNLHQQLQHRIVTPEGQARRHQDYGCRIYRLLGYVNGPTAGALGADYVRSALLADYRVKSVSRSQAEVIGDQIRISASAVAIEGRVIDIVQGQT